MIIYKGKEYYTNSEMIGIFGGKYDYNKYPLRYGRLKINIFEKEKVDNYIKFKKKHNRIIDNVDLSLIKDSKHKKIAIDRVQKRFTLQKLADKYNMSKQNVSLILAKYKKNKE